MTAEQIISLLSVYESEWEHRDNIFYSELLKFYYVTLITMLLPNITSYLKISLPSVPAYFFPCIGIVMSLFFLYLMWGYTYRLDAISITIQCLIEKLPEGYQRVRVSSFKYYKLFEIRRSRILTLSLYGSLIIIGIFLIYYSI